MSNKFEKRVFGAVLINASVANYNADFTGSPRTMPNGVVYATDKALKYCIRNYLKQNEKNTVFYTTRHKKENMQPLDIDETYEELFGSYPSKQEVKENSEVKKLKGEEKKKAFSKQIKKTVDDLIEEKNQYSISLINNDNYLLEYKENEKIKYHIVGHKPEDIKRIPILQNLLSTIDIKLFGATFASNEGNMSIHGNAQITHGINIFEENNIFTEDITSPFRNSSETSDDKMQTTKGSQTILEEGHYLHNFSINPKNTQELVELIDNHGYLTDSDIEEFKNAINRGVTEYNSTSKANVENEFSIFVTLNNVSKIQLPSFIPLVNIYKQDGFKRTLDLGAVKTLLEDTKEYIEKVEIFIDETKLDYNNEIFDIEKVCVKSIVSDKELKKCQK